MTKSYLYQLNWNVSRLNRRLYSWRNCLLKMSSLLVIPVIALFVIVEPLLRQRAINPAWDAIMEEDKGTKRQVEYLVKGCDVNIREVMPENLAHFLFGNCEPLAGAKLKNVFLGSAHLSGADLDSADLSSADLIGADLIGADLIGADLIGANLIGANLIGANLIGAHLSAADLSSANLNNATIRGANLRGASLNNATLRNATLSGANLENISWNEYTKWEKVRGLEQAINVPEALKQQLRAEE